MNLDIGIDIRMMRHTGIGTYTFHLVKELAQRNLLETERVALFGEQDPPLPKNWRRCRFAAPIYSIAEQWAYPGLLKQCRLWHAPHYNVPFFKNHTRLVVTIHDLIHWIYRKDFFNPVQRLYAGTMLSRAVSRADRIITVSESTRNDLIQYFHAAAEKIHIISEGVDSDFKPDAKEGERERITRQYGLDRDYFLYVGSLKPHKNITRLVNAYRTFERRVEGSCPKLVLVGKMDAGYPTDEIRDEIRKEGIVHLPFLEGDDLPALYRHALALAHPSLYEGFGLTVLEAMASGIPVMTSRAASMPEVAGDAAILVDPGSEDQITGALMSLHQDPQLRSKLREAGIERARAFRWERMAEQTAELYKQVLAS